MPPRIRKKCMRDNAKGRPVGAMPLNSPRCVPCQVSRVATSSVGYDLVQADPQVRKSGAEPREGLLEVRPAAWDARADRVVDVVRSEARHKLFDVSIVQQVVAVISRWVV
jgi:hypothetical protein